MQSSYAYSPYIWLYLLTLGFLLVVATFSWRQRQVPGARWFALALSFGILWIASSGMYLLSNDPATRQFWFTARVLWPLPIMTAMLCFMLDYAGLSRWLTRRNLILLSLPCLATAAYLIFSREGTWFWTWVSYETGDSQNGPAAWLLLAYAYLMGFFGAGVFIWLFIRSPQHRWPVAICLLAQVVARAAFILDQFPAHVVPRVDASAFAFSISSALYVVALFGYRMFDPVHLARSSAVRQMREGMLVLDGDFRIAESNPAAQSLLRQSASQLKGRPIEEVLPGCESLRQRVSDAAGAAGRVEICLPSNPSERYHSLRLLPLEDQPGHVIGHLLLIEDITEARQAQARLLEQQRALAALQERTRLARELHDNAGQILGYVSLQAQAVRKWVQDGDTARAEAQLDRLASIAQQGHAELREAIFSLKAGGSEPWSFFTTLRHYLETYHTHYGIRTELAVPAELGDAAFPPEEGVQLLRVIQEALTNAHRHGGARNIRLSFERQDGVAHIQIDDDGCGFDLQALPGAPGEHYGLAFMRERMQQIGGSLSIDSQPGTGTQLTLLAPLAQ